MLYSSLCFIHNIFEHENVHYLVITKFEIVEDFYDVGIPSSLIDMFQCSAMRNELSFISINEVKAKCYLSPYWIINNDEGSDSSIN